MLEKYKTAYGWLGIVGILILMAIFNHYGILKPVFRYQLPLVINPSIIALIWLFMYLIFRNYKVSKLHIILLTIHSYIVTYLGYSIFFWTIFVFSYAGEYRASYMALIILISLFVYLVSAYFLLKKIFKTNFDKFVVINHVVLTGALLFIFVKML